MMQYEAYIYSMDNMIALDEYLDRVQLMIDEMFLTLEISR